MTFTTSKYLITILTTATLFFALTTYAREYQDLEIEADINDGNAEVIVTYEKDGETVEENYEYDVVNLDDLVEKISDEISVKDSLVEDIWEYNIDGSFIKADAQEKISDLKKLISAADEAIDNAVENMGDEDKIDEARRIMTQVKRTLEDAEVGYGSEDYTIALEYTDRGVDEAEEIFDLVDYDQDDFIDKGSSEREKVAKESIDDAAEALRESEDDIDEADKADLDTLDAKKILDEADTKLDDARYEFDDGDFIYARKLSRQSQDLIESIENLLEESNGEEDLPEEAVPEEVDNEADADNEELSSLKASLQAQIITLMKQLIVLLTRAN